MRSTRRLPILLLLVALAASACNLARSEQIADLGTATFTTTPGTATPTGSPTPFRTGGAPTPIPINGNGGAPTAILPPANGGILPTLVPVNIPTAIAIAILVPVPGAVVAGNVQVVGSATHPQFVQYQLEYGPDNNPGNLWYPATGVIQQPVTNGLLGVWNTGILPDGAYALRLRVYLRDGSILSTVANGLRVQNARPTPVPSPTPATPRPIAAFSQDVASGQVPLTVRFTHQSSGQITSTNWTFGDGQSSSETNPVHTYNTPGLYVVTLTVSNVGGSSNVSQQVNATSPTAPVAAFNGSPATGNAPLTVQFVDQTSGNVTRYFWNFSDGTSSADRNPAHTFLAAGTYNVFLTVTGPGGTSTTSRQIIVGTLPTVTATASTAPALPTNTSAPSLPTNTGVPATATASATNTEVAALPTNTPTNTDVPALPTNTETPTTIPTDTPAPSATFTDTPTVEPSATFTETATDTPTPTETPTTAPAPNPADSVSIQPSLNAGVLSGIYSTGVTLGMLPASFAIAGDTNLFTAAVLDPFAAAGGYNLDTNTDLQAIIDFYAADPDADGLNSFNWNSVALGSGWRAADLLDPAQADLSRCNPGETPLACELRRHPSSVILIGVGAQDAVANTDPAALRASLDSIIATATGAGSIPVLLTVPPRPTDAAYTANASAINGAILDAASAANMPVLNIWAALNAVSGSGVDGGGSPTGSPSGSGDLSSASVSGYGANRLNLELLRLLNSVRSLVFP